MDGNLAENLATAQPRKRKAVVVPVLDPLGRWHESTAAAARAWGMAQSSVYMLVHLNRDGWRKAPLPSDLG